MDVLVRATVSNHIGKKYVTAKLQLETKKLLIPTRTGILCFRRKGANIGSGAKINSATTNSTKKITAKVKGIMTDILDH